MKAALFLAVASWYSSCCAFQLHERTPGWTHRRIQPSHEAIFTLHAHIEPGISRRSTFVTTAASAVALLGAPSKTPAADAVVVGGAVQSARVASWPGIENLDPMYELKLSIDALSSGVADPANWPYVQRRLDKFFQGSIFSERSFYFGVGLQYMNDIQYDKAELPSYVLLDKEARYKALEQTMNSLEMLKSSLASPNASVIKDVIQDNAKECQAALASWFALVPQGDVRAVQELFEHVKKADVNRDGRLSDDQLPFLSIEEQELWKKGVAKFG